MGVKSFGPVTRLPERLAELPPGSEMLTEAALEAESATAVPVDASPIWAWSAGAHSASAVSTPQRQVMPERTAEIGRSPPGVARAGPLRLVGRGHLSG